MDVSLLPVLDGYKTLSTQIDSLIVQRDQLAHILFDDIKLRLTEFSTISIPDDLTFFDAPDNMQRGEWNRQRWELTDMAGNFFRAWYIVSNEATNLTIDIPDDSPVFFIAALVGQSEQEKRQYQATLPKWILEYDGSQIAAIVKDKISAAEAEKYPV